MAHKESGYTLLSMLVSAAVTAILAVVAVPHVAQMLQTDKQARYARLASEIQQSWQMQAASGGGAVLSVAGDRITAAAVSSQGMQTWTLPAGVSLDLESCSNGSCGSAEVVGSGKCEGLSSTEIAGIAGSCSSPVVSGGSAVVVVLCDARGCYYAQ